MRGTLALLLACQLFAAELRIDPKEEALVAKRRAYWAFQPVQTVPVPPGKHPIDALEPAQRDALPRAALARRLYLDMTGLPPTPAQVKAFAASQRPAAALIDELMGTPAYAERWATKWLDVVRYADTNGFELDAERPHAYRYRDYVIRSFAANKRYDRFLQEQIAGDELWPGDKDALIATGFLRAGPQHVVGGNQDEEQNRQELLIEMTHAISAGFLGLTMNCARCHNHKFDPILQTDYYRLQAILAATEPREIQLATAEQAQQAEAAAKAHAARLKPLFDEIKAMEKPYREQYREEHKQQLDPEFKAALALPKEGLTEEQKRLRKEAERQITPTWDAVVAMLPEPLKARRRELRAEIARIELDEPAPAEFAYGVATVDRARPTHVLKVGDHKHKLDAVGPGVPLVLAKDLGAIADAPEGRRAALARWLSSPDHPLTPRVMVNRIWQFRMGKGIVATANDFGVLGARPSNAKLLDWLAGEFVRSGWDIRHIDRLILTSAAYQQQAAQRRRLDADQLRDAILATSGMLNRKQFGPPVKTPIEPEIYDIIFTEGEPDNLWPLPKDRSEIYRRSVYLLNKRTIRLPLLNNFDQPDAMSSCPERPVSTHALQGLSLLNSDFIQEQAKAFAARLSQGCQANACRVENGYWLALGRAPRAEEQALAADFFAKGGTVEDFALALLNRNDFVYLP